MANPELIIVGTALAPVAVATASLMVARIWRHTERRRFELEARTGLVRGLGFRSLGRRKLASQLMGREVSVSFGLSEEVGWIHEPPGRSAGTSLIPWSNRDPDELGAPNRRSSAIIEARCVAPHLFEELLVEMSPPVVLRGRRDHALALLEIPLREYLQESERVQWHEGRIRVTTCQVRSAQTFVALVEKVAALASELEGAAELDIERRLVDEALFTRSPEARLRAIRLLVESYDSPLTKSALFRLTGDDDAVVQLNAARALGADGRPKLRALAESLQAPSTIRVAAIHGLADQAAAEARPLLTRLLGDSDPSVATVALRRLGSLAKDNALEAIRSAVVRPGAHEDIVLAGIDYMERIGFTRTADVMHQLTSHRSELVQSAAIDVIGRHGDIAWLVPLRRRLEHYSLPLGLSVSIQSAIALIRARHQADAGRLSLSPQSSGVPLGALSRPQVTGLAVVNELELKQKNPGDN